MGHLLALITGGQVLRTITGHTLPGVTSDHMGKSELAWVDRNRFGIIAGGEDKAAVEREVTALETRYARSDDERQQALLRTRIGRLRGGSAVVYAAGSSESEMRYQTDVITRTIAAPCDLPCCAGRCRVAGRRFCAAWMDSATTAAPTCMKERLGTS